MANALTDKQAKFVELYNGNATEAAKLAGYSHPDTAGKRCMQNVQICTKIQERRAKEIKSLVATRQDRQKFWSDVMMANNDDEIDMKSRLRASELLGKSEGDFLERREHTGSIQLDIRWADET